MAHPSEHAAMVIVLVVAAVALFLAFVALRSHQRTGNRSILFLVGAFGVFAVKGVVVAWSLLNHAIGHEHLELLSSLFDLVGIGLLAMPLIR